MERSNKFYEQLRICNTHTDLAIFYLSSEYEIQSFTMDRGLSQQERE